jgi:XTP/dITP diphosphohydrolase
MDIILATNNKNKVLELRRMLEPLGYSLYTQREKGIELEVEENGTTFEANAYLKAKAIYDLTGCAALADDSGLCVDALSGAPGVYSARYAGEPTDDERNNQKLLREMEGVEDRNAAFVSVICYIDESGEAHYFRGECKGQIGYEELGEKGFGYDPLFMVDGRAYAEMSGAEKDAISHRGNAIRLLADYLGGK